MKTIKDYNGTTSKIVEDSDISEFLKINSFEVSDLAGLEAIRKNVNCHGKAVFVITTKDIVIEQCTIRAWSTLFTMKNSINNVCYLCLYPDGGFSHSVGYVDGWHAKAL